MDQPPNGYAAPQAPQATPAVKDFSRPRTRVAFTIDGDTFEAPPAIPAEVFMEYAERYSRLQARDDEERDLHEMLAAMKDVLAIVLYPQSYELFAHRMRDPNRPIDLAQVQDVIVWLMEQYGMRPTVPSSESSTGPADPEPGTNWTGSTPDAVSTSQTSLSTVS